MFEQPEETIIELIERTAKSTGATAEFTNSVANMFQSKGISLISAAGPYAPAIAQAFQRHLERQQASAQMHANVKRLQESLASLQHAYEKLDTQMKRYQAAARLPERKVERDEPRPFLAFLRPDPLLN